MSEIARAESGLHRHNSIRFCTTFFSIGLIVPGFQLADAKEPAAETLEALRRAGATAIRDQATDDHPVISVHLNFNSLPEGLLRQMNEFTQLRTLDLSGASLSEEDLTALKPFKQLRELSLRHTSVSRRGLQFVTVLKNLEKLDLRSSMFLVLDRPDMPTKGAAPQGKNGARPGAPRKSADVSPLRELEKLPKLEWLDLGATHLRDEDLKDLAGLKQLRFLSLESNYTSLGAGLRGLASLPRLQALDLSYNYLTEAGTQALVRIGSLERLNVAHSEMARDRDQSIRRPPWPEGVADLARLSKLRSLDLSGNSGINDEGLAKLSPLAGLQALVLSRTQITDAGLPAIASLKNLERLDLSVTGITDHGVAALNALTKLHTVNLSYTKLTDRSAPTIAAFQPLRNLELDGLEWTDAGLEALAALEHLETLSINSTRGTEIGLRKLASLRKLESLNLADTRATDQVLIELATLTNLRALDLCETRVTDAGIVSLLKLPMLQKIKLGGCAVTDGGMKSLAALPALESLDLRFCRGVSDAGAMELAPLKRLRFLDVTRSGVSSAGIARLRETLPDLLIAQ